MTHSHVDYLIAGSTPLAQLLAGLLASAHGKTVLLQGESRLGHRLSRDLDLSVAAITRPESWALLTATAPEATKLFSRIGKRAAIARLDPILFADYPPGQQALGHIKHMAAAYGVAAERTPAQFLGEDREGVVLRDAVLLRRPVLAAAIDGWLAQSGVRRLATDTPLRVNADGSATCDLGDDTIGVGQTVLADDDAILAHLRAEALPALLRQQTASCILTEPTDPLAAPVMYQLDGGVMLHQQTEGGILAQGPGRIAELSTALGALLGPRHSVWQAGQSEFVRLDTLDGAPAVGRVGGHGPDVVAGFGNTGAFLAPAIARWLCGQATATESDWFGARLINRGEHNRAVNDIGARP
jgi:hypothetical protein